MRRPSLAEDGPPCPARLSEDEAEALRISGLVKPVRTAVADDWLLVADRKVGTIRVGADLQVSVTPKVEIGRLVFMMGYARDPTFWRDSSVYLPEHEDLPEALAHTFQRLATVALEQGLLCGYRTIDDSIHVVRGRIRTDDQLRLRYLMPLPIEVRYDDFTVDIAENQMLLAATLLLLRMPDLSNDVRSSLHRLRFQLADVTPPAGGMRLPAWQPTRLNLRYQPALRVADLILAAASFEQVHQRDRETEVSGFAFDAWRIFEDFVCVALGEAMSKTEQGQAELHHPDHLDELSTILIEPDFTWWHGSTCRAVVDAKYKAEKSLRFPNADIYQLLAYCTALGLDDGHLIYAKGEAQARSYRLRNSPVTVHCHTLDLAATPHELLAQVAEIGRRVRPGATVAVAT